MRVSFWMVVSALLTLGGGLFYAYMYSITGRWFEPGVYSWTAILLGFGLAGLYVTTRKNSAQ